MASCVGGGSSTPAWVVCWGGERRAAQLPLVAASPLVDALRASPERSRCQKRHLHRRAPLHFLRLFPRVYHLRAPLPLSLSLTPTAADLRVIANSTSC
jgi:hypothetical protein